MKTVLLRALGFFLPTALVVTTLHVTKDASPGEWLDGIASSAWFGLVFLAGAAVLGWLAHRQGAHASTPPARAFARGALLGAVTWVLVWAFWALPVTQPLREHALLVNSLAMLVAASAPVLPMRARRPAVA